jgi:hypothetical protein
VDWLHKIARNMPIFHLPGSGFVRPREEALGRIQGTAIHLFARQVFTDMQILDAYATLAAFANNAGQSTPLEPKPAKNFTAAAPVARIAKRLESALRRESASFCFPLRKLLTFPKLKALGSRRAV